MPAISVPMAPTPRPPQSGNAWAASPRSQSLTGLERSAAKARNSRLMQARSMTPAPRTGEIGAPGSPKSCGIQTLKPSSRRRRAKRLTSG